MRAAVPSRPASDVSGAVGWIGIAGLTAWVLVCRNWPAIAVALNLPGPRVPMSGPYAAVAALLFSAVPMAVWSLAVDGVHRRASTGIDWAYKRPFAAAWRISAVKLLGLYATFAAIAFAWCVARWYWAAPYLFAMRLIGAAAVPVMVLAVPYVLWLDRYLVDPCDGAWHLGAALLGRAHDAASVRRHARAWLVKGFFTAFMLSILPGGFAQVVGTGWHAANGPVALANWLVAAMFLADVQIGTVGYLLTLRPLDAHIRSANPLLAGWVAALMCYPPFVLMAGGGPLDYHANTGEWSYWLAAYPAVLWLWGGWLVALTGVYAWATAAFGVRFSNLTHRGVLTHGPYAWTRHPAYLAKNLFWWSATLPFLSVTHSPVDAIRNTAILALVSGVYFWRAKTEEAHLAAADAKYRDYHAWMAAHGAITARLARLHRQLVDPRHVARPRAGVEVQ